MGVAPTVALCVVLFTFGSSNRLIREPAKQLRPVPRIVTTSDKTSPDHAGTLRNLLGDVKCIPHL
jgi:hypothetical protein